MRQHACVLAAALALCATSRGQDYQPPVEGLVGWWRADGDARAAKGDIHGELQGVTFGPGVHGQAFVFDDPNDRVVLDDVRPLQLTGGLTLQAWIQIEDFPTQLWGHVIFRGDEAPGRDPYGIATNPDGRIHFWVEDADRQERLSVAVPVGIPVHVAGTLDDLNGRMTLFLNGHPVATTETSVRPLHQLDPALGAAVTIGNHSPPSFRHPFRGWIDDVVIHWIPLPSRQIQRAYRAGVDPNVELTAADVERYLTAETLDRRSLRTIADAGSTAVPWLLAATSREQTLDRAHRALRMIGPDAADHIVPSLWRQTLHRSTGAREAMRTLVELAPGVTTPEKIRLDRNRFPKFTANGAALMDLMILWAKFADQLERPLATDPRELTEQLESPNATTRLRAIEALGRLGGKSAPSLEALRGALNRTDHPNQSDGSFWNFHGDYNPMIHEAARIAIARIAPHAPEARAGLEALAQSADDPFEQSRALMSLAALRDPASFPTLLILTESDDPVLVREAITAIGMQGAPPEEAVARLETLADDPRQAIADRARATLAAIRDR